MYTEADHKRLAGSRARIALRPRQAAHLRIAEPWPLAVRLPFQVQCGRLEVAVGLAAGKQIISQLAVQIQTLRLAIELVPTKRQPVQAFIDGIQRRLGISVYVGIVDPQHHRAVVLPYVEPIENECASAANVQIPSWRGGKSDPDHEASVYETA